jgi:glycine/D-amino acid oxidase-like deaminating enzyme
MLSYWEKSSLIHFDFIIIGSGFVGLHSAIQLREKFPNASIAIVERGLLPYGASTKNAGFACTGSLTELIEDLTSTSPEQVVALFEMRKNGLDATRKLLGDEAIGYQNNGSYELLTASHVDALEQVDSINTLLKSSCQVDAFTIDNSIIGKSKFNSNYFVAAVKNNCEGAIDTGLLVKNLLQYVQQLKIQIITGCEVREVEEIGTHVKVSCISNTQEITFMASQLFYCTNAFSHQFLPDLDLQPGRGLILVTKPIADLPFQGIFHFDAGYYYFRQVADRILFGGGRNIDKPTEATTDFEINESIFAALQNQLKENIAPKLDVSVDYAWTGIMAFGAVKSPIIQQCTDRTFCAVRCGGMGVAIAPEIAKQLIALL